MDAGEERAELNRTFKISTVEGMLWQVYATIAEPGSVFLTKLALMLGATPFQFGLISAIGQLSQVFQPLGVAITRKMTSRKGAVVSLMSVARGLALLYGILPFLLPAQAAMWAFLPLFLVATSLHAVGSNAWIGWISDIVPLEIRGRFLARRSQYIRIAGLGAGFVFSAFIDLFAADRSGIAQSVVAALGNATLFVSENLPGALAVLMGFAAVIGLLSARVLLLQPERAKAVETDSFRAILAEPFRDANFRRLLVYGCWWMLVVGIGGPFWGPFMIQKLHMPLINIQIYGTIQTIAALVALRPWGRIIDQFGNKTAMRIAVFMGGINPLVWVFATPESHWFIYLEAFTSGVMWAGAGIVATNFVLAVAPDGKRQIYSGIFGAFSGVAMMVTLLASGAFLPAPVAFLGLHLEPEQVLFGLGGLLRWSTHLPLSWVQEPRAQSVGTVVRYAQHYARTRVERMQDRFGHRKD